MAKDKDDPGWVSDMVGFIYETASELNNADTSGTWLAKSTQEEYGVDRHGNPKN